MLFKATKNKRIRSLLYMLQNSKRSKVLCLVLLTYKCHSFVRIPLCLSHLREGSGPGRGSVTGAETVTA